MYVFLQQKCASQFCKEPTVLKTMNFSKSYTLISNPYNSSDKAFKGTVVNRALPSLHGGSLINTLTLKVLFKALLVLFV